MGLDVLKTEITDDSLTRGYSGMTDKQVADSLNAENRTVNVDTATSQELFEAVTTSDYGALDATEKGLLHAIISMGNILVNGTNTKAALLGMFGVGTDTRANLAALQTEDISRAEELGLPTIKEGNVEEARR